MKQNTGTTGNNNYGYNGSNNNYGYNRRPGTNANTNVNNTVSFT